MMFQPVNEIPVKSAAELEKMRTSARLLMEVFREVDEAVRPGTSTFEIDAIAHDAIVRRNATPAFLDLYGFPASVCSSLNEELVHGIPSKDRVLQEGDILTIDMGVIWKGWYSDRAFTYAVGEVSEAARRLLEVTEAAFWAGAAAVGPGVKLGAAQHAIQRTVEQAGLHIVKKYVGHGIGRKLHEPPQIPNYGRPTDGPRLRPGMTLAVEPMVGLTTGETLELEDGWTVIMRDHGLSSHYEHTIAVTEEGVEILTLEPELVERKLAPALAARVASRG